MYHSMARANLNKSEELVTNTTAASKYIPKRHSIYINLLHKIFKNCFYEANITPKHSHLEALLLSNFGSEKGDFN